MFDSINLKVNRARTHASNLKNCVLSYLQTNPYTVEARVDASSQRTVYFLSKVDPLPGELALIAGDTIQNARVALDYLVVKLFEANGGRGSQSHLHFPFDDGPKSFYATYQGKLNGIDPAATKIILGLEPFRGGKGHQLWILSRLSNIDKHRALMTVGSAYRHVDIGPMVAEEMNNLMKTSFQKEVKFPALDLPLMPADRLFPLETGKELFIDRPGSRPNPSIKFAFEVDISEPGVVDGAPLVETVEKLVSEVENLVPLFKGFLS